MDAFSQPEEVRHGTSSVSVGVSTSGLATRCRKGRAGALDVSESARQPRQRNRASSPSDTSHATHTARAARPRPRQPHVVAGRSREKGPRTSRASSTSPGVRRLVPFVDATIFRFAQWGQGRVARRCRKRSPALNVRGWRAGGRLLHESRLLRLTAPHRGACERAPRLAVSACASSLECARAAWAWNAQTPAYRPPSSLGRVSRASRAYASCRVRSSRTGPLDVTVAGQ